MKTLLYPIYLLGLGLMAAFLSGCDSLIYDEEGDCDPYHKVRFIFDYHLHPSDAFASEVGEVSLYVIDPETGEVVWSRHDDSPAVSSPGYLMDVDVKPGTYELVAWCGPGHKTHFSVNESGGTSRESLTCRLVARDETAPADDPHHLSTRIDHLYHGTLMAEEFTDKQGVHIHTVELKKNTNDVHIVLQHYRGKPVNPDDFIFTVSGANGHLDWDNSLLEDDCISYHPWWTGTASAGVEQPDGTITPPGSSSLSKAQTMASAAIADLRTSRLVKGNEVTINVAKKDGSHVLSLPLIDFALMVKGQHRHLQDQEYLDRQDDYNLIFFLDDEGGWYRSHIYVNSYKVIIQGVEI
ncbi:MAG: FimB/Mfa2 family fimbrial subunit [Muribaculaceae bacterium]|nr:FimB/Mfa2 family fimbrial subunit [Muribaculaceae bacterium]